MVARNVLFAEKKNVKRMAIYIALFPGKSYLEAVLTASTPANDLEFYHLMKNYSTVPQWIKKPPLKPLNQSNVI